MQQPPIQPTKSIPHLAVFDPSGAPIFPQEAESRNDDAAKPRGISQPMYRCGSTLCIVSGEDVFPLPKEMDIPDMEDLWEMFSYEQVPSDQWPERLTAQPLDSGLEVDKKEEDVMADDGDLRPMETLQVHPQIMPPTPKRSSLVLDVSEEDVDMSEYIQQQESVTSIVLGGISRDLEVASDASPHDSLPTQTSDPPPSQATLSDCTSAFETQASRTDSSASSDQLPQTATTLSDNESTFESHQTRSVQTGYKPRPLSLSSTEASLSASNEHPSQSTETSSLQAIDSPFANDDGSTLQPLEDGDDMQSEPSSGTSHSLSPQEVPDLGSADLADLPSLSSDDDDSMLGDTSIETVDAEVTYYNGIPSLGLSKSLSLVKSRGDGSETEEGEEDEDEPLIPRLLTYESSEVTNRKMLRPDHDRMSEATGSSIKAATDPFQPAVQRGSEGPAPKTPRRAIKTQIPQIRGSTEPPLLSTPHRVGSLYEEPRPLSRPFFPCEVSDLRRAGSDDTPSKPLYLLAGVASDTTWETEIGDTPGQNSQDTSHTPWSSFDSAKKNQSELCFAGPALISAPSPSEMIWQKGHVAKPKRINTPVSSKRKGTFVPPAPLLSGRTPETIRTVVPQSQQASQASAGASHCRDPVGLEQSIDSITTHGASPARKRIIQLVGPSVFAAVSLQQLNVHHSAFRLTRQAAIPELRQPTPETVTPRKVSDERSPSPIEQDTLGSIQQIEFDDPTGESIETVTSTDSGLMGRQISLTPAPPSIPHVVRGSAPGKRVGGVQGRGRGGGRRGGNKRAATAAPRVPSLVIAAAASVERNADPDEMFGPPSKKLKHTTARSKTSGSKPSRPIAQSVPTPAMDVDPGDEDDVEEPPRSRSQARVSRSSRAQSAVPAFGPAATREPSQSPDPIGHTPQADDVAVKEEALEEHRDMKWHPRAYSDEEHAMILQLLGPDRGEGFMGKSKLEDICKKLHEFGFMQRTAGAMKTKELLGLNKKR